MFFSVDQIQETPPDIATFCQFGIFIKCNPILLIVLKCKLHNWPKSHATSWSASFVAESSRIWEIFCNNFARSVLALVTDRPGNIDTFLGLIVALCVRDCKKCWEKGERMRKREKERERWKWMNFSHYWTLHEFFALIVWVKLNHSWVDPLRNPSTRISWCALSLADGVHAGLDPILNLNWDV